MKALLVKVTIPDEGDINILFGVSDDEQFNFIKELCVSDDERSLKSLCLRSKVTMVVEMCDVSLSNNEEVYALK